MSLLKTRLSLLAILFLLFPITGCWDIKYLNEVAVVLAMGIDRNEDQSELIDVTVQVALPREVAGGKEGTSASTGEGPPTIIYQESGKTIFEVIRKMSKITSRRLFFAHNQAVIIGESLAKEGVGTLFDLIDRDSELRSNFDILVAKKQKASDVLQTMTLFEKIPVREIYHTVKTNEKSLGSSYSVDVNSFINALMSDKKMPVAGSIEIVGDRNKAKENSNIATMQPEAYLKLGTMAIFNKGKWVDYLNENESMGLSFIQDNITSSNITVSCGQEENASMEIIHSKTRVKASVVNNKPKIMIKVDQKANIAESRCTSFDVFEQKNIDVLEQTTQDRVRGNMESALKKLQSDLKVDSVGFGEAVYRAAPQYWKNNKDRWHEIYPSVPVEIHVKTNIKGTGIKSRSYLQQK
ncbi:MAG: Ger(x)C family spore germination protein [Paenibacillus sp.]|nr:Ger(x)C family spore germination protein [Paenibacillus sp.]